ncbi:MAG: hypothetical protein COU65_04705 [Candidatus Pacebacteria bacterium CG10_big_fil_rev_8_21_14_0_10_42_12]|nr:MAG: hypothetical protein COU65_04705 [Candidatus Pacebacteria bacterium CG10_big_fil_rev_8_21_14_0_10_42_12]
MRKAFSTLLLTFYFPFKLLRKTQIDNFVGGLIFGAIFSLAVNIATVKSQEVIDKQRNLEALEREMVYHMLSMNNMLNSAEGISKEDDSLYIENSALMNQRLKTKVWDNPDTQRYIFELDPNAASYIETYYDIVVDYENRSLRENQEIFNEVYTKCEPSYSFLQKAERESAEVCNNYVRNFSRLQIQGIDFVYESLSQALESFHPTQDRLDNFFLKTMMGDKSVEILKRVNVDLETKVGAN